MRVKTNRALFYAEIVAYIIFSSSGGNYRYSKNMDIYSYFGDATNLTEPFVLWTNQRDFNILEMTMEAIYDTEYNIQQALPLKPNYVHSMKLGIIDANVMTRHTKLGKYEANKCLLLIE